ncbi:thyrostimulin beta-5 subunit [Maniola jurtina]|uniref:thyrostimulin beta-5 subunit n=1 Tax=Maniola jurtina TaxID=191418 RepID=UPI001E688584|nr:thyrostimulin beta-5 subunit [Maniola jurtina]
MVNNRSSFSVVLSVLVVSCWFIYCSGSPSNSRCKLKRYIHKAVQTDFNGLRCWDDVKILSCWGYCFSYEISHWQFPYKVSTHPVCVHGERKHASVQLRNCDPGVEPGTEIYHFVEAANCKCQVCSSEDTSCEWLPPDSSLLGSLIKEELDEIE